MTNIVKDVQTFLQQAPEIQALVTDGTLGEDAGWVNGWIFASELATAIENTEKCAIVVSYGGGWVPPLDQNTWRFPIVVVDIWADPTRAPDHSVQVADADDKAFKIYDAIFKVLHRVDPTNGQTASTIMGETRVTSSESLGEPDPIQKVIDGNGVKFLRSRFGLSY